MESRRPMLVSCGPIVRTCPLGTSLPDQEVLGPIEFQDDVLVEKWPGGHTMGTFDQLVASRRRWIDQELAPWCRAAARVDLVKAADEWLDIAGKSKITENQ